MSDTCTGYSFSKQVYLYTEEINDPLQHATTKTNRTDLLAISQSEKTEKNLEKMSHGQILGSNIHTVFISTIEEVNRFNNIPSPIQQYGENHEDRVAAHLFIFQSTHGTVW